MSEATDIDVAIDGHVATVKICRPPHNFFDEELISALADTLEGLDADESCRATVLAAEGKSFCAGASLSTKRSDEDDQINKSRVTRLYRNAVRLFRVRKPIIAAVHGPAIGGGLGLALVADARITCAEGRFSANFSRLGFHPGFGLSVTLPRLVGPTKAGLLFMTGRRVKGEEAVEIGLADKLVALDEVIPAAQGLAAEIAGSAPLAVESMRETLRGGLADDVERILVRESEEQQRLRTTEDCVEGIAASKERRDPVFNRR